MKKLFTKGRALWGRLLVVCMAILVSGSVYGAEPYPVKLKVNGISLDKLFEEMEKQTGVKFLYNAELIKSKNLVTFTANDVPLEQVLRQVLQPRGLTFSLVNNQVVIRKAEATGANAQRANSYPVNGRVLDAKGVGLQGATVVVDGTTSGTTTLANGTFSFTSPAESGQLMISFIGYKPVKVAFTTGKEVGVRMVEDVAEVDKVTVVGYGVRKTREVVGSISSIKADDIKDNPAPSLESLLQGRMAGVGVTQQSGSPGGGSVNMAIRGYNSLLDNEAGYKSSGAPLYVIDGVPMHSFTSPVTGTNTISEIDPSTIESVEVLKDAASAAIYGSRAANGVILITTKKGVEGRAQFSANVSYSVSELPEAPPQTGGRAERDHYLRMLTGTKRAYYDKATAAWKYPTSRQEAAMNGVEYDMFWNRGVGMASSSMMAPIQDSLNPFYNNSTNWYKYIFRPGNVVNANIQASGGSATMNYMVSGGVYKEKGIMPGSDFIRGNVVSNMQVKPAKNLTLDSRIYLAYTDRSRGKGGVEGGAYESLTVEPQYSSSLMPAGGAVEAKMLQMMNEQSEINTSYRVRGNMVLSYQIIEGLNISTSAAIDFNQANQNFFSPSILDPAYGESRSTGEVARDMLLTNENIVNYNFSAKKHNFDIMAGLSFDGNKMWSIKGHGMGGPNDVEYVGNAFPDIKYDPKGDEYRPMKHYQSDFTETAMMSYFGRVAYNFDSKYLLEATVRRDGSSVFGPEVRWATFPSIAAGWAFSEEKFMDWAWWLNFGKVRASWGSTGSQFGIPYLAQGLMEPGYIFDGVQGMRPSGVLNRKLRWEQSDQYDVGLDFEMFDYRFTLTLDYYYKHTKSLIYRVPMPGDMYGEGNVQWQNAMAVSNEGFELEAKVDIFRDTQVKWRTRLNLSKNNNRFLESYSGTDINETLVIGKGMSGIYLFKDEGFIQTEADIPYFFDEEGKKHWLSPGGDDGQFYTIGMRKISDTDGDGQITEDDMYYAGSALPTVHGGWVNEIRWKDFDLNVLFAFNLGRNMVNMFTYTTVEVEGGGPKPLFQHISPNDFWQKPGDNPKYPAYGMYDMLAMQMSGQTDSNMERVSYCKLKQLTLGYNVPKKWTKRIGISGIRAFVTGENLFTISNYSGLDPEVVSIHSGKDAGTAYPLSRKWTLGLTVNF